MLGIRQLEEGGQRHGKPLQVPATARWCHHRGCHPPLQAPPPGGGASWAGAPGPWVCGAHSAPAPGPRSPDCFFQLGNLTFAEADYQQALALSPKDEGAHLRMDLLQEKFGFCEQRRRCAQTVGGAGAVDGAVGGADQAAGGARRVWSEAGRLGSWGRDASALPVVS